MMYLLRTNISLLFALAFAAPAVAQEGPAGGRADRFPALEALNASYQQKMHDLECRRIADLAALAGKAHGPEADAAHRQLLGLAIAQNLCPDAMAAAARCLASAKSSRDAMALAHLVQMLGHAQKGEYDRALADLKVLFQQSATGGQGAHQLDPDLALAVGEAFLERLIHDDRYDVARKVCDLACANEAPAILKEHFEDRMARLELLGKPAPAIVGNDVDGKPVSLAALNGNVVLVDFWATWCPPCVAAVPALDALAQKYHDRAS